MDQQLEDFLRERDAAFEADDISWAERMLPNGVSPKVVEMAFHKGRMQTVSVSISKRRASMTWLADRSLGDMSGKPVRHDDPLPV